MTAPVLLTPAEAAARSGVTIGAMRYRANQGRVGVVRTPAGHRRYVAADVDAYVTRPPERKQPRLSARRREVLAEALADAIEHRYPGACEDCDEDPAGLCEIHEEDLARADRYAEVGRELGIEVVM